MNKICSFIKVFAPCVALVLCSGLLYAENEITIPTNLNVQGRVTSDSKRPITGNATLKLKVAGQDLTDVGITLDSEGLYSQNVSLATVLENLKSNSDVKITVDVNGKKIESSTGNLTSSPYAIYASTANYAIKSNAMVNTGASGYVWGMVDANNQGWMAPGAISISTASQTTIGGIKLSEDSGLSNDIASNGVLKIRLTANNSGLYIDNSGLKVKVVSGLTVGSDGISLSSATATALGGVMVSEENGLQLDTDGTLSISKATETDLGVMRVGSGLSVNNDGIVSVDVSSLLIPFATENSTGTIKLSSTEKNGLSITAGELKMNQATTDSFGTIKVGEDLSVSDGVLSAAIPVATNSSTGTVKIGSNMTIDETGTLDVKIAKADELGVLKVPEENGLNLNADGTLSISKATESDLGVMRVGSGLSVNNDGLVSVDAIPFATENSTGTIKLSSTEKNGLEVDTDGTLSISKATGTDLGVMRVGSGLSVNNDGLVSVNYSDNMTISSDKLDVKVATSDNLGIVRINMNAGLQISSGLVSLNINEEQFEFDNNGKLNLKDSNSGNGGDLAEIYQSSEALVPGDVVSIDTTKDNAIVKTKVAEDTSVAGVIATEPGLLINKKEKGYKLALVGKVPTKVCDEGGAIKRGDMLVSASIEGYAKKAGDNPKVGTVIGKALENFDSQKGTILVLVNLQ